MTTKPTILDSGNIVLWNADCLQVLPTLEPGSVDAILMDPPYCSGGYLEAQKNTKAQGLRGSTVAAEDFQWFSADNMSTSGLVWLLRQCLVQGRRFLKRNRSALVFTDWRMVANIAPALESSGLRCRNMIIWDKGNAGLGVGFKPAYEVILEFANGSTEYQRMDGQNILRASRLQAGQKEHGAQKPVELLLALLEVVCPANGVVVDAFMGSGSTLVACARSGRGGIGIELDPGYFAIAVNRIQTEIDARNSTGPLMRAQERLI